jgi:hypothetical protein
MRGRSVQQPLDELMTHLWAPAIGIGGARGGNRTAHWDHAVAKLEALRRVSTSMTMFDPQFLRAYS